MAKAKTTNSENKELNSAIKNFKTSSEVENFYRFIHENKIRNEAHILIKTVLERIAPPKKRRSRKLQ